LESADLAIVEAAAGAAGARAIDAAGADPAGRAAAADSVSADAAEDGRGAGPVAVDWVNAAGPESAFADAVGDGADCVNAAGADAASAADPAIAAGSGAGSGWRSACEVAEVDGCKPSWF
jgi:hypothetical protein